MKGGDIGGGPILTRQPRVGYDFQRDMIRVGVGPYKVKKQKKEKPIIGGRSSAGPTHDQEEMRRCIGLSGGKTLDDAGRSKS